MHRLKQVRLLGLGRHPGRRAGALRVDHHDRQLRGDREPEHLGLEGYPRARARGDTQRSAVGGSDGRADGGDLVLRLERHHAVGFEVGEGVEQERGRRDGVAREDHLLEPGAAHPGDETPRQGLRPAHRAVASRLDGRAAHRVANEMLRHFGRFAERVAGVHGRDVRLGELGPLSELAAQPLDRRLPVAAVHPQHQAQRPHVAAAVRLPARQAERFDRFRREPRDVERQDLVGSEGAVCERVGGKSRLGEVALGEGARIHEDRPAHAEILQLHFERGGVHGHEHVHRVAGGHDVARSELDLERRYAVRRPGGGADLGGEIGKGREVVAGEGRFHREARPGHLHAVARVACEANDDGLAGLPGWSGGESHYPTN